MKPALKMIAVFVILTAFCSLTLAAQNLNLSPQQWRQDLKALAQGLESKHADAFHFTPREKFEAAVARLDQKLDHLNADQIYVGFDSIAAMVGDAHTYVTFPADVARFPLLFAPFGDDLRVSFVAPGFEKYLGMRLVEVEGRPVAEVRRTIQAITPQGETDVLRDSRVADYISMGLALHGFGIIPDRSLVRFTLADDQGQGTTVELHALTPAEDDNTSWTPPFKQKPLFRQHPDESFWYQYLPDSHTVYCNFRGYKDLGKHAKGLFELIRQKHPDKLVVDLRQNYGGDYKEGLKHVLNPVRDLTDINRKGHLFVLIGPNTFSAGMNNAAQFRSETNALLVGYTIGETPNSNQEPRSFPLPNSHWIVRYSTKFYKFVDNGENIIRPDQEFPPDWQSFQAGTDRALDWILKYPAGQASTASASR